MKIVEYRHPETASVLYCLCVFFFLYIHIHNFPLSCRHVCCGDVYAAYGIRRTAVQGIILVAYNREKHSGVHACTTLPRGVWTVLKSV